MPKLIKDGAVVDDEWQVLGLDSDLILKDLPPGRIVLPLRFWKDNREQLAKRSDEVGVWLRNDEPAQELGADAACLPLVALHFPAFKDGRGFSTARLLRERYGFSGELRAIGDIMRDQLCYMQRCGFNSFALPDTIDLQQALKSLEDFTEYYQPACDQTLPLFRRRNSGALPG